MTFISAINRQWSGNQVCTVGDLVLKGYIGVTKVIEHDELTLTEKLTLKYNDSCKAAAEAQRIYNRGRI